MKKKLAAAACAGFLAAGAYASGIIALGEYMDRKKVDTETQDMFYPIIYPIAWLYILVNLGRDTVRRKRK